MHANASEIRVPLDRRRHKSPEASATFPAQDQVPYARRETDVVKMCLQHWIELADAALGKKKPRPKPPR
jgi:hypothetical protein